MKKNDDVALQSSFRDPSGHIFSRNGVIFRQVNKSYREHYDLLISSGLYDELVGKSLLISHQEEENISTEDSPVYKVLKPEAIPFISYPFEWCFSQLRDAAMATLKIFSSALQHGMILKDASAYNIQFQNGKPVFIDTLSFERYREGQPWVAYRQFCQHFIAPLALMSYRDARWGQFLRIHLDGIPLDFASKMLPRRTRLSPGPATHLHLHAKFQKLAQSSERPFKAGRESKASLLGLKALLGLAQSLMRLVTKLRPPVGGALWDDYYDRTNYSEISMRAKIETVTNFIRAARAETGPDSSAWDLGANTGRFSRLAANEGFRVVSMDGDHAAVEQNYSDCKSDRISGILPLQIDLTNPTSSLGWAGEERQSLQQRGPADLVMALALIHHLAIGNNVPLSRISHFLSLLGTWLIIEFVPKEDSQVKTMLSAREDIFADYSRDGFEAAFDRHFSLIKRISIGDSLRTLYLMKRKSTP